jgi:hypothetical protein
MCRHVIEEGMRSHAAGGRAQPSKMRVKLETSTVEEETTTLVKDMKQKALSI